MITAVLTILVLAFVPGDDVTDWINNDITFNLVTTDINGNPEEVVQYQAGFFDAVTGSSTPVAVLSVPPVSPVDMALLKPQLPGGRFTVKLRAVDAGGNVSAWSTFCINPEDSTNSVWVNVVDTTPPMPPTNVKRHTK